ncbi:MAG TPA: alpha/beta fold hydrolase [Rhizobacter sp.]|nr:alpha/beta fold hydrolase [Rhizobacter sp.]
MLTALHGFTETDDVWTEVLAPLKRPVRCPLLPGHGWRPCPAGTTIKSVAAEIAAKLPAGGDLLGYSLGGRVALQVALDHPGKLKRLVLISSTAGLRDAKEREKRARHDHAFAEVLEEDGLGPFVAWWESNPALKPGRVLPRAMIEQLRCCRLNQDPRGLAGVLRHLNTGEIIDLWPRLGELKIPVLLMTGEKNPRYVDVMKAMAAKIPSAQLELIPGCGHAVHREAPNELIDLLRTFLT